MDNQNFCWKMLGNFINFHTIPQKKFAQFMKIIQYDTDDESRKFATNQLSLDYVITYLLCKNQKHLFYKFTEDSKKSAILHHQYLKWRATTGESVHAKKYNVEDDEKLRSIEPNKARSSSCSSSFTPSVRIPPPAKRSKSQLYPRKICWTTLIKRLLITARSLTSVVVQKRAALRYLMSLPCWGLLELCRNNFSPPVVGTITRLFIHD